MKTYIFALVAALAAISLTARPAAAGGKQYRYVGVHPIPKAQGGGVCHIQVPHVHVYAQADVKVQYRDHDGFQYFVGDPVAYGWDGPKTAYYGHHPIPVNVIVGDDEPDTEYCYIEGPHFHVWAPPPDIHMELKGGAYWYVGDFPEAYVKARPVYDPIDVYYEPITYERPVVEVSVAPPHWYGLAVVDVGRPPGHVHGGAVVGAGVEVHVPRPPAVRVEVAVPTVEIGIGVHAGGGVILGGGGGHGKFKHKGRGRKRGHW